MERYYVTQYVMDKEHLKPAQVLARFILSLSRLPSGDGDEAAAVSKRCSNDFTTDQEKQQIIRINAETQRIELHEIMSKGRKYDAARFMDIIAPFFEVNSEADMKAECLFKDTEWVTELVLMQWLSQMPRKMESFKEPRAVGVGTL